MAFTWIQVKINDQCAPRPSMIMMTSLIELQLSKCWINVNPNDLQKQTLGAFEKEKINNDKVNRVVQSYRENR